MEEGVYGTDLAERVGGGLGPDRVGGGADAFEVAAKLLMVGAGTASVTVKLSVELALPPGVVTEIFPVVAPLGTVAAIWVELATVKAAFVPLKATTVAPIRLLPVMVTAAATGPLAG